MLYLLSITKEVLMKKLAFLGACLLLTLSSLAALSQEDSAAVVQVKATAYNKLEPAYPTFERFGLDMNTLAPKKTLTMAMLNMTFQNYRQALQFGGNANIDSSQALATIKNTKDLGAEDADKLDKAMAYFESTVRAYLAEQEAARAASANGAKAAAEQDKIDRDNAVAAKVSAIKEADRKAQDARIAESAAYNEEMQKQREADDAEVEASFNAERDRLFKIGDGYGLTAGYIPSIHALLAGKAIKGDVKEYMLVPDEEYDSEWRVTNQLGDYIIYMAGRSSLAVKREKGRSYLDDSRLDLNSYYRVLGTESFQSRLGSTMEIYVLSRLGPRE
jgi:hypothetical protein